ncbi:MAG: ABC transporter permease [Candidatus Geothermincolia bacterium]
MAGAGDGEKSSKKKRTAGRLLRDSLKMQYRDKVGLFWALAFPLLFVLVFGLFYGGGNQTIGKVTVVDKAKNPLSEGLLKALKDTKTYNIGEESWDVTTAKDKIKNNKTSFVIIMPEGFGTGHAKPTITAVYSTGDVQVQNSVFAFLNDYVGVATLKALKAEPIINVARVSTENKTTTFFDVVFAGILCLALMNYNLTGFSTQLTSFREQKILKRLQTTPLPVSKFMGAQIGSFLGLNVMQVAILLVVGVLLFKAHIYGSYLGVAAVCLLGAVTFLAMGFMIASFTKTANAATGMATSLSILFMFLSGVFFPIDSLPNWIYQVVRWLPLSPMVMAMRNITLQQQSLASQWQNLLILAGWLVIFSLLTIGFFRFGEE